MPVRRRSQKAGSCSFVNQKKSSGNRRRSQRAGARKSQRAGGCGYTGDARRAGARRSMKGGGNCDKNRRLGTRSRKGSRKSKSKNRKRVVVCPAPDGSCRRR